MTRRGNIVITKVADLIDHEIRVLEEALCRELFWAADAERILKSRWPL